MVISGPRVGVAGGDTGKAAAPSVMDFEYKCYDQHHAGHKVKECNPIIRNHYTADPTVIVHEGTVYLYTGHDDPPAGTDDYCMNDWLCFSSTDLMHWTEHPSP